MPGRRRTPVEIENIVAQFEASGRSRRDFVKRQGIGVDSLAR